VGAYEDIQGLERGLDAHHVGQKALMDKFVAGYELEKGPAILVPKVGHTAKGALGTIVTRSTKGVSSARSLLARDIMELRRVYGGQGLPNSALEELIQLNKSM